jgi:Flp pilus assembly pilin Flp
VAPTSRSEARALQVVRSTGRVVGRVARAGAASSLALVSSVPALGRRPLRGQGIVEYGLILSLSAALTVVLLVFFSGTLSAVLNAVGDAIDAAS